MENTAAELVQRVSKLISPPEVWLRINELVEDPTASVADIARVAERDPGLTSGVLKIVNSAYYGFTAPVDTVTRAVTLLGCRELHAIATTVAAAKVFNRIPNNLVRPDTFWRHSLCTAVLAKRLAVQIGVLHPERLYVAGLLHDVGHVVLYNQDPAAAAELLLASDGDEEIMPDLERERFGFDHAELGGELARCWRLSDNLAETIRWHHDPLRAEETVLDAAIVHFANVLANREPIGMFAEGFEPEIWVADPAATRLLGQMSQDLEGITEGLEQEVMRAVALMIPPPRRRRE